MKIAVLSGKGGTGKTFLSVNLASSIDNSIYIDCDVEEPNGRIFFQPENVKETDVTTPIPHFDKEKCKGCRKCVDFCNFNALVFIRNLPKVFTDVCHACGGCALVCPYSAITEVPRTVGKLEVGKSNDVTVVTGILNLGEASAVPVIKSALDEGKKHSDSTIVIDCPPGSSCSVMESISDADYCIIVTENTSFGFENFKMVYKLTKIMGKKCGVVINKYLSDYPPILDYCKENNIQILLKIPYLHAFNDIISNGKILVRERPEYKSILIAMLKKAQSEGEQL